MSSWFEQHFQKGFQKGWEEGVAQGMAKARAESVLLVLAVRGFLVDAKVRQRILSCTDLTTLGLWLERAVTATRISDVLEDPAQ